VTAPRTSCLPFVVTMGEPAGIGGEMTLMAWLAARAQNLPVFAAIDDADRLEGLAQLVRLDVPILRIRTVGDATNAFDQGLPVLHRPLPHAARPGTLDPRNAPGVIAALDIAVRAALGGEAAGIVTNPIHKESLYSAGFSTPGHTEYLATEIAKLRGEPPATPVMMLTAQDLRVVPVTIHQALRAAIDSLTPEKIITAGRITAKSLRDDFGIAHPRLAVAALNPHAGEGGTLGREEIEIIAPAVNALRTEGLTIEGPLPADTLFHSEARTRHDAVLCMYHDQALIPLKTVDFWGGVNATLGLDIVRTSPDHGTALDIAGTGRALPSSFIEALKLAALIADNRARRERSCGE